MILEVADIRITPGKNAEFEDAIQRGLETVLPRAKGYIAHKVHRVMESPERYLLMIWWQTLEHHTVEFRQGAFAEGAVHRPVLAVPRTRALRDRPRIGLAALTRARRYDGTQKQTPKLFAAGRPLRTVRPPALLPAVRHGHGDRNDSYARKTAGFDERVESARGRARRRRPRGPDRPGLEPGRRGPGPHRPDGRIASPIAVATLDTGMLHGRRWC
jgi:heme-degrading monooxygenase HmoA